MILSTPNISIHLEPTFSENCLLFEFTDKFTEQASIDASNAWTHYMNENTGDFILVWDCTNMDGFEMSARKKWYDTIKHFSKRILFIHVVANNIIVRSAAKVMLGFFGIKGIIVRTMDELKEKI